jgi:hypothetical protein
VLISVACCSTVTSILLNEAISVTTSSWRPDALLSLPIMAPRRATVRAEIPQDPVASQYANDGQKD